MKTTLLGEEIASPICIAPTAFHGLANSDAEVATARAAASSNTCYCMATYSNKSIEDVFEAAKARKKNGLPLHWFQLYVETDREGTKSLVQRAERAGYKALVITCDRPRLGRRYADVRNMFKIPSYLTLANFVSDASQERSGGNAYAGGLVDASLAWKDVEWFKSITKLPIVLKGIFRPEDAKRAVDLGVKALIVSNHGGRQLDGAPATIELLPSIVHAVQGKCEVYVDGGIRKGTDVFKALALGAKAVFLGRPIVWGLAYDGERGVKKVIDMINWELRTAMALAGTPKLKDITPDFVVPSEDLSFSKTFERLGIESGSARLQIKPRL